jgi:transcription-repair coupling factor (superfamily II helicase)
MNSLNDIGELDDMKKEMVDRFGSIPRELEALFSVIELKIEAGKKGVTSLTGGSEAVEIKFSAEGGSASGGEKIKPLVIKTKGLPKEKWFDLVRDRIRHLSSG